MAYSKRPFALDSLPLEERWRLSTGEIGGKPAIVRMNESAALYVGHPEMPVRVGLTLPLQSPDGRGLPSQDEQPQLAYVENVIFELVDGARIGRVVLVVTMDGFREFVAYVRSDAVADELARELAPMITTHELQAYRVEDPQWVAYRQMLPAQSPDVVLASGKASRIISCVVGWTFVGLAAAGLAMVLGLLVPMVLDGGLGSGASDFALAAMIVLLPLGGVGILAYVGVRFLQQGKSPA